jgi:hypothetical protein
MRILDLAFLVPIVSIVPACATTEAAKPAAAQTAPDATAKPDNAAKADAAAKPDGAAKPDAAKEDADDEKETKAEKIAKKTRALDDARLELTIARQDCESEDRKAKDAVEEAEHGVTVAREALDHFVKIDRPLEIAKVQFNLDRSKWTVQVDTEELDELMAMYGKDDVATLTKELVVNRNKKKLEFANRDLANDQVEATTKTDFELPKKQKELELALKKAENALREAKAEQMKQTNENELKLRKSEHPVDDLKKEIEKLNAKKDAKVTMTMTSVHYGAF